MGYVIGLDQGGTKTAALIVDRNGRISGIGYGPGACHSVNGMAAAMEGVRVSITNALAVARADIVRDTMVGPKVSGVFCGMSGADFPKEFDLLLQAVVDTLRGMGMESSPVRVVNDSIIAMRAGTGRRYGAVAIAGTESNVAILSPTGETFTYGYYIDESDLGGRALGKHVLRAVFDAHAGLARETELTGMTLNYFGMDGVGSLLMEYSLGSLGDRVKDLALLLFDAAHTGDSVAIGIVRRFGTAMGRYVGVGLTRMDMCGIPVEVVLSGSVFKARTSHLKESLYMELFKSAPLAELVEARFEPVVGAAILALEEWTGKDADIPVAALLKDCGRMGLIR